MEEGNIKKSGLIKPIEDLSEVNVKNLTYEEYLKNEVKFTNLYENSDIDLESQVHLFKFMGNYPKFDDLKNHTKIKNDFENQIIEKYVVKGSPSDDYLILFIKNKQKIFDALLTYYSNCNDEKTEYFIVEKMIFLFLEHGKEFEIRKEHLLLLTRVMKLRFSFVLAGFFSRNAKILIGTPYAELFLPRLDLYIKRMSKSRVIESENEYNKYETINEIPFQLPNTLHEVLEYLETEKIEPDYLIFYIFTAPPDILEKYREQLFNNFIKATSPIFATVYCERVSDYHYFLEVFFTKCSETEKFQLIKSLYLLKDIDWKLWNNLRSEMKKKLEENKVNPNLEKDIYKIFGFRYD